MKKVYLYLSVFLAGALVLQLIPYIMKGDPIDWPSVFVELLIFLVLVVIFWVLLFSRNLDDESDDSENKE